MSTIHSTHCSSTCKHLFESIKTSSLLVTKAIIFLSSFFFPILLILFHFPNSTIPFHMPLFSIMKTFDFISRLVPSLKLVMTFLSSIPVSSSTFYDERLCIFLFISLPLCLFIEQIFPHKLHTQCTIRNKVANGHNKSFPTV